MDYSRHLVLYSGGIDSTYFVESEPTAKHLIHFKSRNKEQYDVALTNANILNRYISVIATPDGPGSGRDGETNQIHALYDTEMALQASIIAVSYGMKGIVMCFNADDIGIDYDAVTQIMHRVEPDFEILLPLIKVSGKSIRESIKRSKLKAISCMNGVQCGYCPKCTKTF
ncbi:hypothetical protein [Fibrella aestuarina]|uniref:hypothetical protein n=1 Tax=Fibrella aestuarina TaxID=651143 RepID=UPI00059CF1F3|nr:hypothetical protein [Fibrella aestuarina]